MRVTSNYIINKFARNLNTGLTNLDRINTQVASGRKFSRASEDTGSALKALKIRREISRMEQYIDNARDAQGILSETESIIMGVKELLQQAQVLTLEGVNGTMTPENRVLIADSISNLQDQLIKIGNTKFSGKYLLGGPNTGRQPFEIIAGELYYNGEKMSEMSVSTEEVLSDVGLGIATDSSGNILRRTAISITTPGSIVFGFGEDSQGISNNIYNLLGQIADKFRNNDIDGMDDYTKRLQEKVDSTVINIVDVGEKSKFVDFLSQRFDDELFNLFSSQTSVEAVDPAKAIIDFKVTEMAYRAALQIGTKIIQPSLMDYLS